MGDRCAETFFLWTRDRAVRLRARVAAPHTQPDSEAP